VIPTVQPEESIPTYNERFERFNGRFEQWVQFSDALRVYAELAYNLNNLWQYNML